MIAILIFLLSFGAYGFDTNKDEVLQFFWHKDTSLLNIDDHSYIRNLANKIEQTDYDFFIINDNSINAFATEAGLIGINKGLINLTENESELAAVLAHEIAHIKLKHFVRFQEKNKYNDLLLIGSVLLAGLADSSEASEALISTAFATNASLNVNFTRSNEVEADNYGKKLLDNSVFDTSAMSSFFAKLIDDEHAIEFIRTHPLSKNRVINNFEVTSHKPKHIDSFEYLVLKARFNPHEEQTSEVASYIQALENFEKRNYAQVLRNLKGLNNLVATILKGRAFARLGDMKNAITHLSGDDELSKYYLAVAYFVNNQYDQALRIIKEQNSYTPSVYNYHLIADIELQRQREDKYHYNKGLAHILTGYKELAKHQFELAKNNTQDRDLLSVLNYKISTLTTQ